MTNYNLSTIYGNLSPGNQPLSDFDGTNDQLARMGVLMCSANGTNTVTLTSLTNYPTMTAYGSYQKVGFVAANSTTTLTQILFSGLATKNAYAQDGATQINGGSLTAGSYYEFAYNSTLNSGAGGWQLVNASPSNSFTVPAGVISGMIPSSVSGTSTTASLTISAGQAASSSGLAYITFAAPVSWAVSNGNAINGYSGGTTLPNSTTIHFFSCSGASGTGSFAAPSLTPTFPSGYTTSTRRVFSLPTNSSGVLTPGAAIETEGGSLLYWLTTQVLDISTSAQTASRIMYALTVPTGIKVQPIFRASTTSGQTVLFTSGDETDIAPQSPSNIAIGSAPGFDMQYQSNANVVASIGTFGGGYLTTNTSGQIGARASSTSVNIDLVTRGFKDFRRS